MWGDLGPPDAIVERDFALAGEIDYMSMVDVAELSGTTYLADFYTRETDTDQWQHMGGVGAEGVDTNAIISFPRLRYVKVIITVTGDTFESGVVGY